MRERSTPDSITLPNRGIATGEIMDDNRSLDDLLGTVIHPVPAARGHQQHGDSPSPPTAPETASDGDTSRSPVEERPADRHDEDSGAAFVYVPTKPYEETESSAPQPISFELRRLGDGSAGLAVYTDLQQLITQLGEYQPWVKISALELLVQLSRAEQKVAVVVNPVLADGAARWTEADLAKWPDAQT